MAQPSSEGEFVTRDGPANLGQSLELPYVNKERKPSPARSRPPPLRQSSTSSEPRSNRDRPRAQDSFTPDTATYRTPNEQSHYNDRPPPSTSSSSRRLGGHVDIELCMDKHINPHRQAIVLWQPYMQVKRGTIWKLLITPDRLQHTAPVLYCRAYSQCEVLDIDGCVQFQMILSDGEHAIIAESSVKKAAGGNMINFSANEFLIKIAEFSSFTHPTSKGALMRINKLAMIVEGPPQPVPSSTVFIQNTSQIENHINLHQSIYDTSQCLLRSFTPSEILISIAVGQGQALHLWAPRAVLEARSPFFADLQDVYVMGVAQTQDGEAFPRPTDLDKSDGDDLSDEVVRSQFAKTGKLEPLDLGLIKAFQPGLVQVIVTNFRYTTWKAVISWLLTGEIHFAPLDCQTSKSLVREGCDFIPPSPRSVYRLAATLSLPELQKMALQYILEGYKSPDQLRDLENEFVGAMLQEHKELMPRFFDKIYNLVDVRPSKRSKHH